MEQTKKEVLCLLEYITGMMAKDIDVTKPFSYYGCDSLDILDIEIKCEQAYGIKIDDTTFPYDAPIETFIQYIDKKRKGKAV